MADKEDAGPPPLEDPNSPDYVCVYCQSNVDALCLECQEMAELTANSTRNDRDDSDRDTPLDIDDESQSYVGHMILHEDPESPGTRSNTPQPMSDSDSSDSAYYADTIIDSPRSTDTTLDLNDIIENVDEAITRARNVIICGAAMKGLKFKPLILGGRFDRDSDSETDYSDMPPLEETKKNKEDSDEDSDDMPPLEEN